MMIACENIWKHLSTVLRHKWLVFKYMCKCGHPIQGLLHDMSKFSPTEFWTSVKYYQGTGSPINAERDDLGYSKVWLHHKGRNKHHSQYWIDCSFGKVMPAEIPWKYFVELLCDGISAGQVYCQNAGKEWTQHEPMEYYNKVDHRSIYHPKTRLKLLFYYNEIDAHGLSYVLYRIKKYGDYSAFSDKKDIT